MDGERFDAFTARWAGASRRGALRLLAGGALAAVGGPPRRAAAAACAKAEGQRCRKTRDCCEGRCHFGRHYDHNGWGRCGCGAANTACDASVHAARCCPGAGAVCCPADFPVACCAADQACCVIGCCPFACDLRATLTGFNEVDSAGRPGQGDPDGTGYACVDLTPEQVCWDIAVANIGAITEAHIHEGGARQNGPIRVDFEGVQTECAAADQARIDAIRADPGGFYVDVHTEEFPDGAIRGQLG
jgi:hypothetical protein